MDFNESIERDQIIPGVETDHNGYVRGCNVWIDPPVGSSAEPVVIQEVNQDGVQMPFRPYSCKASQIAAAIQDSIDLHFAAYSGIRGVERKVLEEGLSNCVLRRAGACGNCNKELHEAHANIIRERMRS